MDIAGELMGALLLFGLLAYYGQSEQTIRAIFTATLLPGIIAVCIMMFFVKDAPKTPTAQTQNFAIVKEDLAIIKTLMFYFFFIFFFVNDAFFTMRAKEIGIEIHWIPLLFVLSSATQTILSLPIGNLIDKIGHTKVMSVAYLAGVIAQLLLLYGSYLSIWIAYALLGIFTVAALNANRAYIAQRAHNKGSVYGVFYAGIAIFGALGAIVSGFIWEHFGAQSALLFALVGTTVLFIVYLLRARGREN